VIKENEKAISFWKKNNFQVIGEVNNGEFDLLILERKI
jgi:hypothetical protein